MDTLERASHSLSQGVPLGPPRSLPYRALARSCPTCGDLLTTPDDLLRADAGPTPRCPPCDVREVIAYQRERASEDAEYAAKQKRRTRNKDHRWQQRTLEQAKNRGKEWTGPELELLSRDDLTRREMAEMLGRTYYAVSEAKRKLNRDDPKFKRLAGMA